MRSRRTDAWRRAARVCAVAAVVATVTGSITPWAAAQTWVSPASGVWSDPLNWSAPPVSGATTDLWFPSSGAQSYVATDDFPGPFMLRGMIFNGTSTGPISVNTGSLSWLRHAGGGTLIDNRGVGPVLLNGRVQLDASATVFLNPFSTSATNVNATLRGAGSLVVINQGMQPVTLGSGNTFTGGALITNGRVDLGAQTSLGPGLLTVNGGGLGSAMAVTPSGNPPFHPVFANNIALDGPGLLIGGANGYTLSGNITGTGGLTLSPVNSLNQTWTITGSNSFTGPVTLHGSTTPGVTSTLVFNSPASIGGASQVQLNGPGARVAFAGGSAPVTIGQSMSVGPSGGSLGAQSIGSVADVTYAGGITGTGPLTRTHGGVLTLGGTNNTFTGTLTLADGTTVASTSANLGGTGSLVLAGGALLLTSADISVNRPVLVSQSGSTVYVTGAASFNGISSGSLAVTYNKAGAGTMNILSASTFVGSVNVNGGTINLSGGTGRLNNGAGSLTIGPGAGVRLDNSFLPAARMNAATTITLNGGNLTHRGSTMAAGTLTLTANLFAGGTTQAGAGFNTLRVDPQAGANTAMRFQALTRAGNNGAMMLFTGPALGANTIASATPGASNISFATAPTALQVNGILPFAIADATGGPGTDFATYSASNGVMPLAVYAPDLTSGATSNASVGTAAAPVGGGTINALKMTGGTVDATTGLRVTSGAFLVTGASTVTGGTISIGTATTNTTTAPTANFFTVADLTVDSRIVTLVPVAGQASGIAKGGPGTLTLTNLQNYNGPTRVLGGTLRLGTANAIPANSELFLAPGAALDLTNFSNFNVTMGTINQTEPATTIGNDPHGTVDVGANTLITGADNFSTQLNTDFTGTGTIVKTGLGTMTVIGNQAFTGTVTLANGALALGTHFTDGTGLRNASRINVGTSNISGDVTLAVNFGIKDGFDVPVSAQAQAGRVATLRFVSDPEGTPGVSFASPITLANAQGLVVDSSGGATLSGVISGPGPLTTATSAVSLQNGPDSFALNLTGANTYTGATTLTAISTLWGHASAFGNAVTPIGLGHTNGPDNPELSSSVGGLTLSRNITVNDSLNGVAQFAVIGSQAPAGSATTTYAGNVNIAGSRSKLVLYSRSAPVAFTGVISGAPGANVQIGDTLGPGLEWTSSNVTLAGANTYAGGTQLVTGSLNFCSSTALTGSTILSGTVGTGTLTIGSPDTLGAAAEPTLAAVGGARTVANPVVVANHFSVAGTNALTFSGAVDLGGAARHVTVNSAAPVTISGPISGASGSALVKAGPGALVLSGTNSYAGPTVAGGGTLTFAASQNLGGLLAVSGGAFANVTPGGGKVLVAPAVSVETSTGSRLDLANNNSIVDYASTSPIAQVTSLVASAYNGGAWTGPGITSTTAAGVTTHGLGIGEAGALGITNFAGQFVDGTAVLLRYTRYGDADLNGQVNLADFNRLAANFGGTGKFWHEGDFTYDGVVNLQDVNRLAATFGQSAGPDGVVDPHDWANLAAAVPEPAGAVVAALLAALPLTRRRHRRN